MVMQNIVIPIIIAVVGGLILHFFTNGWTATKKLLNRILRRLHCKCRLKKRNRLLVYLSSGGTCRDPMAKVITEQFLKEKSLPFKMRIEAMALGPISAKKVSYAARNAIKAMYEEDILEFHTPKTVTKEVLDEADLVLVMDNSLMQEKILPKGKTSLFKKFFDPSDDGDVVDPYPDGKDQATLTRYRKCAEDIKTTMEGKIDILIDRLELK